MVVLSICGCSGNKTAATVPESVLPDYDYHCGVNVFINANGDLFTWGADQCNISRSAEINNQNVKNDESLSSLSKYSLGQGENVIINNQPKKVLKSVSEVIFGKYIVTKDQQLFEHGRLRNGETFLSPHEVGDGVVYDSLFFIDRMGGLYAIPEKILYNPNLSLKENSVLVMETVADTVQNYKEWIVLKQDGTVWSFGFDYSEMKVSQKPKMILKNVVRLIKDENGTNYNVGFLTRMGDLYISGDNEFGACGNEKTGDMSTQTNGDAYFFEPNKVLENVSNAWINLYSAYAVTEDGVLYGWGLNDHDLMLTGEPVSTRTNGAKTSYRTVPVKIMENVREFAPAYSTAYAIKKDYTLWVWGARDGGMLGVGDYFQTYDKDDYSSVARLVNIGATYVQPTKILDNVKRVFKCGYGPVFAEKQDGRIWYWGRDSIAVEKNENWDTNNYNYFQKYYIIPTPIEFSVDTYFQTALNYIAAQTGEDISQYQAARYINDQK